MFAARVGLSDFGFLFLLRRCSVFFFSEISDIGAHERLPAPPNFWTLPGNY
jgi:hypothetical protein